MIDSPAKIRIMRISDYDRVYALWKKAEGIGLGESDAREAIARFLKRNPNLSVVATAGRRIVGAILCGHDGRRGYLHHLVVSPRLRRKGLGRRLVAVCLDKLHSEGIPKCNLFVFASNASGKAFWRRIGWTVRSDLRLVQRNTAGSCDRCRTSC